MWEGGRKVEVDVGVNSSELVKRYRNSPCRDSGGM